MSDGLARALGGLALVVTLGNGVMWWSQSAQISDLQAEIASVEQSRDDTLALLQGMAKARAEAAPKTAKPARVKPTRGKRRGLLSTDERKERIERKSSEVREALAEKVHNFAMEHKLDETTQNEVFDELLMLREESVLVREEMREGALSNTDGRAEIRELRHESHDRMVDLVGEKQAEMLYRKLFAEK